MGAIRVSTKTKNITNFLHIDPQDEILSARVVGEGTDDDPKVLELTIGNPEKWCDFEYLATPPLALSQIVAYFPPGAQQIIPDFHLQITDIPPYTNMGNLVWTDESIDRVMNDMDKSQKEVRKRHKARKEAEQKAGIGV